MKIRVFHSKIYNTIFRFYLMMAIVAIFGFLHQFTLAAIFGFTIAISAILGVSFERSEKAVASASERKVVPLEPKKHVRQAG